jgi:hypothetical protein
MTTISEFIEGPELDKIIVHNCDKYRKSFISIVEKSGVGDTDVEEFLKDRWWGKLSPPTKKIMGFFIPKFRSWNWAGFFFNVYWLIYRKQRLGWLFLVFFSIPIVYTLGSRSRQLNLYPIFSSFRVRRKR